MPTPLSSLGPFGLVKRLTEGLSLSNKSSTRGVGDDAAVMRYPAGEAVLATTDLMLEGVDFDLTYFPPKHLGYKLVTAAVSDLLAMNARPSQLLVSLGVSAKIPVEMLDELYAGLRLACRELGVDLVGGDTRASVTGLVLSATALGHAPAERVVGRDGAREHDLICLTGNVGAAYMGLQLLEREKKVLAGGGSEPEFGGFEYLLQRYLRPRARLDVITALAEAAVVPTSMIDLSDGLSSDTMQLCAASGKGAKLFLERIPIARQTSLLAEQMHIDPVVAALNGGEDHELLFTVPLADREKLASLGVDIIGHITASTDTVLVTPDGAEIALQAQGFTK